MARLISYKATNDESEYATFIDERSKSANEHEGNAKKKKWWRYLDCCGCCESNLECDDDKQEIEFALIKDTKVSAVCADQQTIQA